MQNMLLQNLFEKSKLSNFHVEEYREGKPKSCQGLGEFSYSLQLGNVGEEPCRGGE